MRPLFLITALLAAGGCVQTPASRTVEARLFRVVRVIDGDTLKIIYDETSTSVRLPGIQAPERGKPGFARATAAMVGLVGGRTIRIEFVGDPKRDNFGRLLATVWVVGADGVEIDVGAELLRLGVVDVYTSR